MQDIATYRVAVRGAIGEDEVNRVSPLHVRVFGASDAATTLTARTDQSGLIGLVRHLHGQGFVLLFVIREDKEAQDAVHIPGGAGNGADAADET